MNKIKTIGGAIIGAFTGGGIEMPDYTVVSTGEGYEERDYPQTMWVSTTMKSMTIDKMRREAFWRLFEFIQGKNEKKAVIPMTAPVSIKIIPGEGPNCESTLTMSFYVGKEFQADCPKPESTDLFLETWDPMSIYVRTFGGFANDDNWIKQADELGKALPKDAQYIEDYYRTAGYDSPFKLFKRRNEVWFIKKGGASQNSKEAKTDTKEETSAE